MLIYNIQKQFQIEQYQDSECIHDLPPIHDYWYEKHIKPKFMQVFGLETLTIPIFYASELMTALLHTDKKRYIIASIGSGNGSLEADIYLELIKRTDAEIIFECFEISSSLIEQGKKDLETRGLKDKIHLIEMDLNNWKSQNKYDGVIAHHSLHHIVNLENLFAQIALSLQPWGLFVSADTIGRNGHMRWNEALVIIQSIWKNMPEKYKYNQMKKYIEEEYENFDCSQEGFEGIRAQDILKLLTKQFNFKKFLGYGNLIDIFVDRCFGLNFNLDSAEDREFIDKVNLLNELLIDFGFLKPTYMLATMNLELEDANNSIVYKHWTPKFCLRELNNNPLDEANPKKKINLVGSLYQVSEALRYYDDRWIASDFDVELNSCDNIQGISIEGFIPSDFPIPNKIYITINDKNYDYEITNVGLFSIVLSFEHPKDQKLCLNIKAEKCWNGFLQGVNGDRRNLVFMLEEIKSTNPYALNVANLKNKINLAGSLYQVSEALRYYDDRWIASDFYVELNCCQNLRGISIEGFVPQGYPLPNKLSISINEKKFDYKIKNVESFSILLPFEHPKEQKLCLTIKAEKSWNGFSQGVNDDPRNLVFILKEIKSIQV